MISCGAWPPPSRWTASSWWSSAAMSITGIASAGGTRSRRRSFRSGSRRTTPRSSARTPSTRRNWSSTALCECVGSDATAVRRTVLEAAKQPKAAVTLSADFTPGEGSGASARVRVRFDIPDAVRVSHATDIMVAVTENGLVSRVERGENRGRTMHHSAVVRSLTIAGTTDGHQEAASADIGRAIWRRRGRPPISGS